MFMITTLQAAIKTASAATTQALKRAPEEKRTRHTKSTWLLPLDVLPTPCHYVHEILQIRAKYFSTV